jgi:2-oxoacid dehydrogenases acyltransferase (catalytic domain)
MRGRRIPLSRARRLVIDFLHFSTAIPTVPVQRRMHIQPVIDARSALPNRPAWTAIFVKAFALVSAEMPELRRAFLKLPWRHLHEYPQPVASVAIERDFEGDKAVLVARIKDPASLSLPELSRRVRTFAECPVRDVKDFRRALRTCLLPRPIRRLMWWIGLNYPSQRIRYFGTFGVSVYSGLGAESLHPLAPLTTILNYGVFSPDGQVDVRVVYDHRVMDGAIVARALARLEEVLAGPIVDELRELGVVKTSRAA